MTVLDVAIDAFTRGAETHCTATGAISRDKIIGRMQSLIALKHDMDPLKDLVENGVLSDIRTTETSDGVDDRFKNMNYGQLVTETKRGLKNQDNDADYLIGVTATLKGQNQDFESELKRQAPLLEGLKRKTEETGLKFVAVNSRMGKLIAEIDNCKLYTIIAVESFCILLLLLN